MKKAILVVKKIAASILHFLQSSIDGSWRERERGWGEDGKVTIGRREGRKWIATKVCVCAVQRCWGRIQLRQIWLELWLENRLIFHFDSETRPNCQCFSIFLIVGNLKSKVK